MRERLSTDIADDIETTRAAAAALSARTRTKEGMARLRSLGERLGNLRAESTAPTLLGAILETLEAGAVVSLGESHDHRHLELLVFTRNRALLDELHVQSS